MKHKFTCLLFLFFTSFSHAQVKNIIHIKIAGGINPASQSLIERAIKYADQTKANAVLIELNTPGGLLTSTRSIVQNFFDSNVPVIVYVSPSGSHAGSAGVFLTLAAHVAAMAPGTNIGAAHPVSGQGGDIEGHMAEKVTNDTAAWVESIAKTRGRNQKWAIAAVRKSVSIDNETALKQNVIDLVSPSVHSLLKTIHGRKVKLKDDQVVTLDTKDAQLISMEFKTKEKIIDILSNPNIAYILMMVGMVGIYIELSHPGAIFPGVIGAISLILSFICLQALPINYGGLALLLLGLALLIAEIFIPSFGILGIGGIVAMLLGSIFLIDPTGTDLVVSLKVILPTVLTLGGIMFFIAVFVVKALRSKSSVGSESFLGKEGNVISEIQPGKTGKVFVYGDYWNATSQEALQKNDKIVVEKVDGMVLNVKKRT